MVLLKSIFFAAITAIATPIPQATHSPGFKLILSDLKGLDFSVKQLTIAINSYTKSTDDPASIFEGVKYVNATNRKAYNDALTIGDQNLADSQTIVNYISSTIAPDIQDSTDSLNLKKESLLAAGLKQQILDGLNLLLGDHESLSSAIAEKLSTLTLAEALVPATQIDVAIRATIEKFEV